jgi:O-antigen ligase/polysaccharide polymerase Wzy-like membrane protein
MTHAARRLDGTGFLALSALVAAAAGAVLVQGAAAGQSLVAATGVIGVMCLFLGWKDERLLIGLFVLSFLTVSHPDLRLKAGGLWIPIPAFLAGVLCARELIVHFRLKGSGPWPQLPLLPLLLLAAGFIASGFTVVDASAYASEIVKWAAHLMVFVTMTLALRRERWVYAFADGLTVVVAALAAYGLFRVFTGRSYDIDVFEGVASRSAAAFYITATLPIVYARLVGSRGAERGARSALFTVLLTAQVFTYTRAAWIASTCGLLFVAGRRLRAYLWVALALAVLVWAVPQEVRDRFQTIFTPVDYGVDARLGSSTVVREHLLRTGIEMVRGNWLLGVGLGNYWDNYARYAVPGSPLVPNTPHNFWILLWAEAGVLSVVTFAWFYAGRFREVWSAQRRTTGKAKATLLGFAGCFVALVVESQFSNDLNLLVTWTLLGAGTALAQRVRRPA